MGLVFTLSIIAVVYNLIMFQIEGGFSMNLSSRLFWLFLCVVWLLVQLNLITYGKLFRMITGEKLHLRDEERRRQESRIAQCKRIRALQQEITQLEAEEAESSQDDDSGDRDQ